MKKIFSILMMGALVAFTSCTKETSSEVVPSTEENVSISVGISSDEAQTRAFTDPSMTDPDGNGALRLCILISYDGKIVATEEATAWDGTETTFDFRLVTGHDYVISAWADFDTTGAETMYKVAGIGEAPQVEFATLSYASSNSRDGYFGIESLNFTTSGTSTSLVLKRPFGLVTVTTGDLATASIAYAGLTPYSYERDVVEMPTSLDLLDGTVGDKADVEITGLSDGALLSYEYILAEDEITVYTGLPYTYYLIDDESDVTSGAGYTFTNIPVRRNYKTNIFGDILTSTSDVTVEVDQTYLGTKEVNLLD